MSCNSKDCDHIDYIKQPNNTILKHKNNNKFQILKNKIKSLASIIFILLIIVSSIVSRLCWSSLPNRQLASLQSVTDINQIACTLKKMLFYWSCGEIIYAIKSWLHIKYEFSYQSQLNNILLDQIKTMMPAFVAQYGFSDLRTYFNNAHRGFDDIVHKLFIHTLPNVCYIITSIAITTYDNLYLGLLCMSWCIALIIILLIFLPKIIRLTDEYTETNTRYKRIQTEALIKYKIYYLYNAHNYAISLIRKHMEANIAASIKLKKAKWIFRRCIDIVTLFFFGGVNTALAIYALPRGIITTQMLVAFIMSQLWLIMSMFGLFENISNLTKSFGQLNNSIKKISSIPQVRPDGHIKLRQIDTIKFENVVAIYNNKKLFKPLNCIFQTGDTIAIIGPSGCGKTTIINMVMDFFHNYIGRVLFNGENIDKYTIQSIRNNISFIQQEKSVISSSVRDNLAMGFDLTDQEMFESMKVSKYHDNPSKEDLDKEITATCSNISGGQAQRLSLSRFYLHHKKGKIIVADEPTSSLDPELARACLEMIIKMAQACQQICIVVTHNIYLASLLFKKILFLHEEQWYFGSHKELYKKHDFYRSLFKNNNIISTQ